MALKSINSLAEIIELARTSATPVYVRWSVSAAKDVKSGHSYNHQTGGAEAGLSVNNLLFAVGATSDDEIALQLLEYRYLTIGTAARPWLLTGDVVGRGSDNEPLLANATALALVGPKALAEADEVYETIHGFRIDAAGRVVDENGRAYKVSDAVREQAVANTARIAALNAR